MLDLLILPKPELDSSSESDSSSMAMASSASGRQNVEAYRVARPSQSALRRLRRTEMRR